MMTGEGEWRVFTKISRDQLRLILGSTISAAFSTSMSQLGPGRKEKFPFYEWVEGIIGVKGLFLSRSEPRWLPSSRVVSN